MFGIFKGLTKTISAMKSEKQPVITKDCLIDMLLEADVPYEIAEEIAYYLPPSDKVNKADLNRVMKTYFLYDTPKPQATPFVQMIIGVNGAGKTTTVAKLANLYKSGGKSIILGASDTFRAGAIEQLKLWAQRLQIPIVASSQGHDPASVAFDAISSAVAKKLDFVLIDTAGRLQNQKNLSNELEKIVRISNKAMQGAPHQKILVLDGTQGSAAIAQAKAFNEIVKIDGIIITKLDGTAKGGALFGIARELELPILFVGVGEKPEDLIPFSPDEFVNTITEAIFS